MLRGAMLEASIVKKGYVSGVEGGSFLDKKTGTRDLGFGLDIQDWIMEPGSDEAYRSQLPGDLPYVFGDKFHGQRAKRSIKEPQICTQAKVLQPREWVTRILSSAAPSQGRGRGAGCPCHRSLSPAGCRRCG